MAASDPAHPTFFDESDLPTRTLFEGVTTALAWGRNIMLSLVRLEPGSRVPEHAHPHEQAGICLQGRFELTVGGRARVVRQGQMYIIPGGTPHAARGLDAPCKTLDIFSPPREEYKTSYRAPEVGGGSRTSARAPSQGGPSSSLPPC